jgi:Holliday junction resolvase RusA-like endonuclease
MPPSMNAIWRSVRGRVVRSERYKKWRKEAGQEIMIQRRNQTPVKGNFVSRITLSAASRRGDLDNRAKPIFDLLQEHRLIEDDKHMDRLTIEWGDAPKGRCQVRVEAA